MKRRGDQISDDDADADGDDDDFYKYKMSGLGKTKGQVVAGFAAASSVFLVKKKVSMLLRDYASPSAMQTSAYRHSLLLADAHLFP